MTPDDHLLVMSFWCSNIKNVNVQFSNLEVAVHSVQGCNIMQRDRQEPDEISHERLHLENSIFDTTTYSRVCFQELYMSAADPEGKFATEIASLSSKCCCTVMIPHIWSLALYL